MPAQYIQASEVAALLRVSKKTVARWAREGQLPHFRTMGGHRRYPRLEILRIAADLGCPPKEEP